MGKFDETIEKFKKVGALLKKNGIQLTYHNHDFEFNYLDGEFILEKIYAALPDLIEGEVDTCWARYAGVDPAAFIEKYKGRILLAFVFCYLPIWGWRFAFFDYTPGGNVGPENYVGFKWFSFLFRLSRARQSKDLPLGELAGV